MLVRSLTALYSLVRLGGSVLFIGDPQTYVGSQLHRVNYLINGDMGGLITLHYSNVHYHYHKWSSKAVARSPHPYFDLAVVCVDSVAHLHSGAFYKVARLTMGPTDLQTRPDFFNYPVPPIGSAGLASQLIIDVATAAYLSRSA